VKCVSVFLLGFAIVLLIGSDRGLGADPIAEKLEKARNKFDESMKKAREGIKQYYEDQKEKTRKNGDKELFDKLTAEWKAFDNLGTLPLTIPEKLKLTTATPWKELEGKYIETSKSYSKAFQRDLAENVELEWEVRYKKGLTGETKFEPYVAAAEELLNQAELEVLLALGTTKTIKKGIALPDKPFVITSISFSPEDKIPYGFVDESFFTGLQKNRSLVHVKGGFPGLIFTDFQIARFAELPVTKTLATLEANFELTAKSIVSLKRFAGLSTLSCSAAKADDAVLAKLVEFSRLHTLRLHELGQSGTVTKKGMGDLTLLRISNLELLDSTAIDREFIRRLQKMPYLRTINFFGSDVVDEDLKELARCPHLQRMVIGGTSVAVTDKGLAHLCGNQTLAELVLDATDITDEGLDTLAKMKALKSLSLKKTKATEAGVKKLAATLPLCKIQWDGGIIEPMPKK
jgi:hypothetical protein